MDINLWQFKKGIEISIKNRQTSYSLSLFPPLLLVDQETLLTSSLSVLFFQKPEHCFLMAIAGFTFFFPAPPPPPLDACSPTLLSHTNSNKDGQCTFHFFCCFCSQNVWYMEIGIFSYRHPICWYGQIVCTVKESLHCKAIFQTFITEKWVFIFVYIDAHISVHIINVLFYHVNSMASVHLVWLEDFLLDSIPLLNGNLLCTDRSPKPLHQPK